MQTTTSAATTTLDQRVPDSHAVHSDEVDSSPDAARSLPLASLSQCAEELRICCFAKLLLHRSTTKIAIVSEEVLEDMRSVCFQSPSSCGDTSLALDEKANIVFELVHLYEQLSALDSEDTYVANSEHISTQLDFIAKCSDDFPLLHEHATAVDCAMVKAIRMHELARDLASDAHVARCDWYDFEHAAGDFSNLEPGNGTAPFAALRQAACSIRNTRDRVRVEAKDAHLFLYIAAQKLVDAVNMQ